MNPTSTDIRYLLRFAKRRQKSLSDKLHKQVLEAQAEPAGSKAREQKTRAAVNNETRLHRWADLCDWLQDQLDFAIVDEAK